MGFKEVTKVHLSTIGADFVDNGFSKARWHLKAPVQAPNPNYKIKVQVANAVFPNSYDRISVLRENNSLVFAYQSTAFTTTTYPFDLDLAIKEGRYIKVVLSYPINQLNIAALQKEVNDAIQKAFSTHSLIDGDGDEWNPLDGRRYRPWLVYDGDASSTDMTKPSFHTFSFYYRDSSLGLVGVNEQGNEIGTIDPNLRNEPRLYEIDMTFPYADNTVRNDLPNAITYRLVTQADLLSHWPISEEDVRLANVLGWPRTSTNVYVGYQVRDQYEEVITTGLTRAIRAPDFTGTRYLKMISNLNVPNVDPNTKDFRNILAVVPLTESTQGNFNGMTFTGATQSAQYMTIGQSILDTITIELYDDHDKQLNMHADWLIELAILFEAPEETDAYRGMTPISAQSNAFYAQPNPYGYHRFLNNAEMARRTVEAMEVDRRTHQV